MSLRLSTILAAALPWGWFAVRDGDPAFEVVAILIPPLAVAAAVGAVIVAWLAPPGWRAVPVVLLLSTAAAGAVATAEPRLPLDLPEPRGDTLYLVAANLAADNPDAGAVIRGLASGFPDVVVTAETSDQAVLALAGLEDEYPYIELGQKGVRSRLVVYSKHRLTPLPRPTEVDFAQVLPVVVDAELGSFTLFAAHLPRPWASGTSGSSYQATLDEQQAIATGLASVVRATEGPVVVAGDLNLTDRGRGYRTLLRDGGLTDVVRTDWAGSTSLRWWPLALRIDHVLAGGGLCGADPARLDLPGSDHRGLWVELGRCPDTGPVSTTGG